MKYLLTFHNEELLDYPNQTLIDECHAKDKWRATELFVMRHLLTLRDFDECLIHMNVHSLTEVEDEENRV